jgi:hypothetical protein
MHGVESHPSASFSGSSLPTVVAPELLPTILAIFSPFFYPGPRGSILITSSQVMQVVTVVSGRKEA